uniref:CUB domain-containing protein n=1 Tax=Panagrolaimus sp. ES5 TaxID=591445 RepID=A0AC34FB84_9BILA
MDCSPAAPFSVIHYNTLVLLETQSFPKSIPRDCNINLVTEANNNIWVALLNGKASLSIEDGELTDYDSINDILTYNTTTNRLSLTVSYTDPWTAIQAAAISFDPSLVNHTCPLAGQTFDFTLYPESVIPFSNKNSEGNFFLLVSAVHELENYTSEGCSVDGNSEYGIVYLRNGDYKKGYPSYQQCEYDIEVDNNYESVLTLTESYLENCCDTLFVAFNEIEYNLYTPLTLTSEANRSQFVFTSDGNTQGVGYKATLETFIWLADMNYNDAISVCATSGTLEVYVSQLSSPNNHYYDDLRHYKLFDGDDHDGTLLGT